MSPSYATKQRRSLRKSCTETDRTEDVQQRLEGRDKRADVEGSTASQRRGNHLKTSDDTLLSQFGVIASSS